jgi:hypothetical protein
MPHGRKADGATQLDVERMIIDFLVHMANKSIFDDYEHEKTRSKRMSYIAGEQCEKHLQLVKCKLNRTVHWQGQQCPASQQDNLHLLKRRI